MEVSNEEVLKSLFRNIKEDERAVLCSLKGDPSTADGRLWAGVPWKLNTHCPLTKDRNNYVAISSFGAHPEDGRFRRRKDQFRAVHLLMVDDVGTKIDHKRLPMQWLPATMAVETSPGNYQVTYALTEPMTDQEEAESAIKQMIDKLTGGGVDPGMAGVTRVLRLPNGINGKQSHVRDGQIWSCRLAYWRPDISVSWDAVCSAYGIVTKRKSYIEPNDAITLERKRGFELVKRGLEQLGQIKNMGGAWFDIRCPWIAEHTGRADTGAAVAAPAKANGYMGGFRCHHGHCTHRNWGDLEDWVADAVIAEGRRTRGPFYVGE